ncbi:MAG TPA: helix-turn-helix transcriptional regulator [Thermodesulfobacteriota bacterium]
MSTHALDDALVRARRARRLPSPAARRQLRVQAGLTQLDIARALGVTRECVARWELGCRTPRGVLLDRYIELLDRLAVEAVR